MLSDLTELETDVLRTLNGEGDFIGGWGAWVAACVESLRGRGLVAGYTKIEITPAGRRALEGE